MLPLVRRIVEDARTAYLALHRGLRRTADHRGLEALDDVGDLPEDVQREYLPLLAPWFEARHAERVADLRARLGGR